METTIKVGDWIIHHYCGGSDICKVKKINKKSVRCVRGDRTYVTYPTNKVTKVPSESVPLLEKRD